jgi:hypothetical protein
MLDIDLLIQLVHNYPAIWEKSLKEYSDRNKREKSWVNVAKGLNAEWSDCSDTEKHNEGKK